jgi:hypothetical protein
MEITIVKNFYKLSAVGVFLFIIFVAYGIETDCPDTAGYVYCEKE